MKSFTYKQLGTMNKMTLVAETLKEAKTLAAKHFGCRECSCFHIQEDGQVTVFVGINRTISQKLIIKSDDIPSARQELVLATNSSIGDWEIIDSYLVPEKATCDIQYETLH